MRQGAREGQLSHIRCPACTPISPVSSPSPPATANGYSAASLGLHRACPRCGPSPGPGAGRGVGDGRLARTPAPSPGHSPARRRAEPSLTGPRCRRPARPSPRSRPLPLHLRQAPPRRYRDGEHKEPRPHARPFPVEEKLRCTRVQTRTRPARAGEGISYLSPRCYSSPPPIHPPMEVWPPPAPRWVPRPPARSGCTHCLTARAQRLQGPAAAAGTETAAAAAAAAAAPAGVSQTGAAKPHRPY